MRRVLVQEELGMTSSLSHVECADLMVVDSDNDTVIAADKTTVDSMEVDRDDRGRAPHTIVGSVNATTGEPW